MKMVSASLQKFNLVNMQGKHTNTHFYFLIVLFNHKMTRSAFISTNCTAIATNMQD